MTAAAQPIDARTSRRIGTHSDAVTIPAGASQVVRSGTSGLRPDGTLPEDFAEEAGQASDNVCEALRRVGAGLSDVGLVRSWFADRDDSGAYVRVRKDIISHRPAYMLVLVPQLIRPSLCLEVEATAVVMRSAAEQHE
ncbi:Rid family hydrolase [Streptomyces sp. NBC_00316]|uniref:Rid family hydrolase n=1 Tax=Streptomyces sp. NBC_00316 TaxID=2975710 RepID=UPI002E292F5C|nr:Rid family hydrolase [Streptomyces sp. NBC_00316]